MTYGKGKHPNSLANLTGEGAGRPEKYDEPKKRRELSVTETGWDGAKKLAARLGCSGVSDLLEKLGRGELPIVLPIASACADEENAENNID